MKKILCLTVALIMMLAIFGCAKAEPSAEENISEVPQTEPSESQEPVDKAKGATVACCMGFYEHPVHRVIQYGFCVKAEELGMNPLVSGINKGSQQELIDKWNSDIEKNNAAGALIWTGDDSCYEMMKALKEKGVYFVVPHFAHSYEYSKTFIDKNIAALGRTYGASMADYLVEKLYEAGITEGPVGMVQPGSGIEYAITDSFAKRMEELDTNFTVLDLVFTGNERTEAINKITGYIGKNPDMVGALDACGGAAESWVAAMENTGNTDIIVVSLDFYETNLTVVENGLISAIMCVPWHEEGRESANALYELINGAVFNTSESEWFSELEAHIAYVGGEGVNDIQTYRDIYNAAQKYFKE